MADKPKFDPTKPFAPAATDSVKPKFDPSKPFEAASTTGSDLSLPVTNDMPEGFGTERFLIKNLGADTQSAIDYLKREKPGYEYAEKNGEILIKKPSDKAWGRLDPQGFDVKDLTDIGADIATGVGATAATAIGGLSAGLPGAVAAGGLSSGALEALRQKLGVMSGVNKDVSTGDVLLTGAIGSASPLLMGSGATAAQVAKKALSKGVSEQSVKQAQRGVLKFAPAFIEQLTSVPSNAVRESFEKVPTFLKEKLKLPANATNLDATDAIDKAGSRDLAGDAVSYIRGKVWGYQEHLQKRIGSALKNSNLNIDVTEAIRPFDEKIMQLYSVSPDLDTGTKSQIDALVSSRNKVFEILNEAGQGSGKMHGVVTPEKAMQIKQNLKVFTNNFGSTADESLATKDVAQAARDAYHTVSDQLDTAVNIADEAQGQGGNLLGAWKNLVSVKEDIEPALKNKQSFLNFMRNPDTAGRANIKQAFKEVDKLTKAETSKMMGTMNTWAHLSKEAPAIVRSQGGATATQTGNLSRMAGSTLGGAAGFIVASTLGLPPNLGGISGAAAGGFGAGHLLNPANTRTMLKSIQELGKTSAGTVAKKIRDIPRTSQVPGQLVQKGLPSAWQYLNEESSK